MKVKNFIILVFLPLLIISCESENEKPEMEITIGTICGWCAGSDSLVISSKKTTFTLSEICDRSEYRKSKLTKESDWNELIGLYDQQKFGAINVNTCNVCADGCDTWIRVENGEFKHEIRFGYQDSTLLIPIQKFVERLDSMKNQYK